MDEKFYHTWFQGFLQGLEDLEKESRSCLLKPCAKRCADSGILEAYRQHYVKVNGNRDEFYRRMDEQGGVSTPNLCECSRQSIIYVAQMIWNTTDITVECLGTVLSGQKECKFRICFQSL